MKKYNFYAGPSILSPYAIEETAKAVKEFAGTGLSLLEISHRSKEFQAVMDEAQALVKELYDVPEGYDVVFLGGGASLQFCMVPYNLLKKKASYIDTGTWANKAIKEAKLCGEVNVVASSKADNYVWYHPPQTRTIPTSPRVGRPVLTAIISITLRTIRFTVRRRLRLLMYPFVWFAICRLTS